MVAFLFVSHGSAQNPTPPYIQFSSGYPSYTPGIFGTLGNINAFGIAEPPNGALNPRFVVVFTYSGTQKELSLSYDPNSKMIGLASGGSIVPFSFKAPGRGNVTVALKMYYKIGLITNPDSVQLSTPVVVNVP